MHRYSDWYYQKTLYGTGNRNYSPPTLNCFRSNKHSVPGYTRPVMCATEQNFTLPSNSPAEQCFATSIPEYSTVASLISSEGSRTGVYPCLTVNYGRAATATLWAYYSLKPSSRMVFRSFSRMASTWSLNRGKSYVISWLRRACFGRERKVWARHLANQQPKNNLTIIKVHNQITIMLVPIRSSKTAYRKPTGKPNSATTELFLMKNA